MSSHPETVTIVCSEWLYKSEVGIGQTCLSSCPRQRLITLCPRNERKRTLDMYRDIEYNRETKRQNRQRNQQWIVTEFPVSRDLYSVRPMRRENSNQSEMLIHRSNNFIDTNALSLKLITLQ